MIYIHVPFCRSFCTYCGFYSEICSREASQQVQNRVFDAYVDAVIAEIAEVAVGAENAPETLYFGGGTPSVLPLRALERIVKALGKREYQEFTIEVNPDDIVTNGIEYVRGLVALGVNRVSMGVQSFDDGILRWMNRRHGAAQAREAYALLRQGGITNVSIDLIFGLSQLSEAQWRAAVREAIALNPEHISAYQLSIDEDSALAKMVADGRYVEADEEQCRSQYDILCAELSAAGYHHYEISNWAKPGFEAVHNSAYWRRVPYIGLGPGAHSFDGKVRSWNSQELARRDADGMLLMWSSDNEELSATESLEETIMLALRTAEGIDSSVLRAAVGEAEIEALVNEGALACSGGHVRIPEDHFFVSDDIIADILSCI